MPSPSSSTRWSRPWQITNAYRPSLSPLHPPPPPPPLSTSPSPSTDLSYSRACAHPFPCIHFFLAASNAHFNLARVLRLRPLIQMRNWAYGEPVDLHARTLDYIPEHQSLPSSSRISLGGEKWSAESNGFNGKRPIMKRPDRITNWKKKSHFAEDVNGWMTSGVIVPFCPSFSSKYQGVGVSAHAN